MSKTERSLRKLPLTNSFDSDIVIKMDNLIRIYDNVLSENKCDYFVNKFEKHSELHEVQDCGLGKTLTLINLMATPGTPFRKDLNYLSNIFMESVERYKKDCHIKSFQFPDKFGVEAFKIKRYLPNTTDEFPEHVDVRDRSTARRFLVMFAYLTNNEAGETEISVKSEYKGKDYEISRKGSIISSSCKQGSLLLFPPMWPWMHTGIAPAKTAKYIIGSYLHYV